MLNPNGAKGRLRLFHFQRLHVKFDTISPKVFPLLDKGNGKGCVATRVRDRRMERHRRSLRIARPQGNAQIIKNQKEKSAQKLLQKQQKSAQNQRKINQKTALKT